MFEPGSVAIVGVGATEQGELLGRTSDQIALDAIRRALADAGIDKADVDGLITCKANLARGGVDVGVGALAGLNPRYSATLDYGTCNFSLHLGAMVLMVCVSATWAAGPVTDRGASPGTETARNVWTRWRRPSAL